MIQIAQVFLLTLYFAIAGYSALVPWRSSRFMVLAAPLAGVAAHSIVVGILYGLLGLSYFSSVIFFSSVALIATIAVAIIFPLRMETSSLLCAAIVIVVAAVLSCWTSMNSGASILYMDGTDHAGYAHMADWFRDHKASETPVASPAFIYQSWPELLLRIDTRFGAFAFLATVAEFVRSDAIFAYDIAIAVALAAGVLGVGGLFASQITTLSIVVGGLFLSHWFDYAHSGYLGKLLGYPSIIFISGLFLKKPDMEVWFAPFLVLAAGTAGLHSGQASALIFFCVVCPALFCQWGLGKSSSQKTIVSSAFFSVTILVLLVATGLATRPLNVSFPDYGLSWDYILPRIVDTEAQGVRITGLSVAQVYWIVALATTMWALLLALAVVQVNTVAIGLLVGLPAFFVVLFTVGGGAVAFQLIGVAYPLTLCAGGSLLEGSTSQKRLISVLTIGAVVASIATRVPRFLGSLDRYVTRAPKHLIYSSEAIAEIRKVIGRSPVIIDVVFNQSALVLLTTLGRSDETSLQWTNSSWDLISSYRKWQQPNWARKPIFRIKENPGGGFIVSSE